MPDIKESDWRHVRDLKPVLLDRYCRRILSEFEKIASKHDEPAHPRYLALFKLVDERDRELGDMFNDLKRSNAIFKILFLRQNGVFTEAEFAGFSDETKSRITLLQGD
ncbi:hypothetical protein NHH73_17245 [Oxalobacteraceae bacterium OTU3CINTB1]|nr:hypothetical protein NHH73_17245 [Oxalobacteraceae bacterium OTU3CINTB1]